MPMKDSEYCFDVVRTLSLTDTDISQKKIRRLKSPFENGHCTIFGLYLHIYIDIGMIHVNWTLKVFFIGKEQIRVDVAPEN